MKLSIKFIGILIALSFGSCGTGADSTTKSGVENQTATIAKNVSVEEFRELIKSEGVILDVRTPGECQGGMIEGAINIDYMGGNFDIEISKLDKNTPIYIYCASGGRSSRAMNEMTGLGYSQLYNLLGGYSAWK